MIWLSNDLVLANFEMQTILKATKSINYRCSHDLDLFIMYNSKCKRDFTHFKRTPATVQPKRTFHQIDKFNDYCLTRTFDTIYFPLGVILISDLTYLHFQLHSNLGILVTIVPMAAFTHRNMHFIIQITISNVVQLL